MKKMSWNVAKLDFESILYYSSRRGAATETIFYRSAKEVEPDRPRRRRWSELYRRMAKRLSRTALAPRRFGESTSSFNSTSFTRSLMKMLIAHGAHEGLS